MFWTEVPSSFEVLTLNPVGSWSAAKTRVPPVLTVSFFTWALLLPPPPVPPLPLELLPPPPQAAAARAMLTVATASAGVIFLAILPLPHKVCRPGEGQLYPN